MSISLKNGLVPRDSGSMVQVFEQVTNGLKADLQNRHVQIVFGQEAWRILFQKQKRKNTSRNGR